jgi:Tfp pilus assembly protein PilF
VAQTFLEQALNDNPDDVRTLQALARCYIVQKRIPAGTLKFQEYTAQRPQSPWGHEALGEWLTLTGSPAEARNAFAAAKAADPNFSPADLMLSQIDMSEGKLDSARNRLSGVLARNDQDVKAHISLGALEIRAGRPAAALDHYKRVVQLQPSNADALNNLAYLLLNAGQPDEALAYAQRTEEIAPDDGSVHDTIGWALYRKGVYSAALQHLQKAVSQGNNAVRQYHLAMAYVKVGDLERAQVTLDAASKMDPKVPEAAIARQTIADAVQPQGSSTRK